MILSITLQELLLISAVISEAIGVDYCTIESCATGDHTMCKYPDDTVACPGDEVEAGLTDEQRQAILDRHNSLRQTVALGDQSPQPAARDMMEMTWHEEAALIAQRWANQCVSGHDTCRNLVNSTVGQNIAASSVSLTSPDVQGTILSMVDNWFAEVEEYDPAGLSSYQFNSDVSHYTQMVWANTNGVGCGFLQMEPENTYYRMAHLVCNYVPAGNVIGQPVYKEGEACSECPAGSGCSDTYPGLCK